MLRSVFGSQHGLLCFSVWLQSEAERIDSLSIYIVRRAVAERLGPAVF
jgi:hypothetical protein